MMEAVRTSETSVDNHFTRQYNPEDSSEQPITITNIIWLTLFKEIISVHSDNNMKSINTLCGQSPELLIVKTGGT
jgi:hypothetical protein